MKHLGRHNFERSNFGRHPFGSHIAYYRGARPHSLWNVLTDVDGFFDRTARAENSETDSESAGAEKRAERKEWTFTPRANVDETKDAYRLSFDLPGVKKEDVKIDVHGRTLTVSGERKREVADEKDATGYSRYECVSGSFSRSFTLPEEVDAARVGAVLADGVLKVTLPKTEEQKPRSIEVK